MSVSFQTMAFHSTQNNVRFWRNGHRNLAAWCNLQKGPKVVATRPLHIGRARLVVWAWVIAKIQGTGARQAIRYPKQTPLLSTSYSFQERWHFLLLPLFDSQVCQHDNLYPPPPLLIIVDPSFEEERRFLLSYCLQEPYFIKNLVFSNLLTVAHGHPYFDCTF